MPPLALGRGRNGEEEDDGEIKAGEKGGKKGQVFECEKCSKVSGTALVCAEGGCAELTCFNSLQAYRHATCLSKHRA